MIRALIADDELVECKGLEWMIHKDFPDIQVMPYALNGVDLLHMVRESAPEILLLDINMPGLGGLEALEIIRYFTSDTHVIVVSAFSKFSYAQEAMRLGASDYLVKPVAPEELAAAIQKQLTAIESVQNRNDLESRHALLEEDYRFLLKDQIAMHFVMGGATEGEIRQDLELLGIRFYGVVGLVCRFREEQDADVFSTMLRAFGKAASCLGTAYRGCLVLFLFPEPLLGQKELSSWVRIVWKEARGGMPKEIPSPVCIGVSTFKEEHKLLFEALSEAVMASREEPEELFSFYDEYALRAGKPSGIEGYLLFRTSYLQLWEGGREEEAEHSLQVFAEEELLYMEVSLAALCISDLLWSTLVRKPGLSKNASFWSVYRLFSSCDSHLMLVEKLHQQKDLLLEGNLPTRQVQQKYVRQSLSYLYSHYMENLSLESVAQVAGITPYYLSRLFKQELQETFLDILTDIRLEKAVDLLIRGDVTSKEVSRLVGYPNSNYFLKLFKGKTGMTIGQMRECLQQLRK